MNNYSKLPEHMQPAAMRYIEHGVKPGDFMFAVLTNNLVAAFSYADAANKRYIYKWVEWLMADCPEDAWGSKDKVFTYMRKTQNKN